MIHKIYILTSLLLFMVTLWLAPWWANVITGLVLGFLARHWVQATLTGLFIPFLIWSATAGIIDQFNQQILSQRIAELMSLPSPYLLVLITGIIGAVIGGLSMSTGFLLKSWLRGQAF